MIKNKVTAIFLVLAMVAALSIPSAWAEDKKEDTIVHIGNAAELREFARKCALDSFSVGVTVVLDNSFGLDDEPFYPIPTFGGTFDGCGYTISGLTLATDGSHQGLFRYVQAGGVVKRLKVSGSVTPDGSMCQVGGIVGTNYGEISKCVFTGSVKGLNYVGGIAGENYGTVRGCAVSGSVSAKRFTGGIVGINFGMVSGCENNAAINTDITAGGLELEKLSLSGIVSTDLTNAQDTDVVSDTGGIVGFSEGTVQNSSNYGTVGYPHYGYNVGGIAGRQCGLLTGCTNEGEILGRKDVAGIVGQMEPDKNILDTMNLSAEIATLNALINVAMNNLSANSSQMKQTLDSIQQSASSAADKVGPTSALPSSIPGILPTPSPTAAPTASPTTAPTAAPTAAPTTEPTTAPAEGGTIANKSMYGGSAMLLCAVMPQYNAVPLSVVPSTIPSIIPTIAPTTAPTTAPTAEPTAAPSPTPDASEDLTQMAEDFKTLNSQLDGSIGGLAGDMRAVSNQLARVLTLLANALSGSLNLDVVDDISAEDPKVDVAGTVSLCVNKGNISADTNVGGVVGDMGIEYEFDLENQLMGAVNEALGAGSITSTVYEAKCVLHSNKNYGTIEAKKDNAGCVAGAAEMGVLINCEAYGSANSTEGGYVGGIVGISNVKVVECYAMCSVDGNEYVGGIAGNANFVSDCYSLVNVGDVTSCCGAIVGLADMTQSGITGNSFVHETLGAVDGISYSGIAEPMSYENFMKLTLPEDFNSLKLSFVADGIVVKEINFEYGGSIDESEIPAVPEKNGYSGEWPEYDYSKLYFNGVIEAVYISRQATMAVEECRDGSPQPIALVEGDFNTEAKVRLNEFKDDGVADKGEVLEKWVLRIEGDEAEKYSARYLAPETNKPSSSVDIYVYQDGEWIKADTRKLGSYISFDASGDTVIFCAVETVNSMTIWIIAAAGAAVAVVACFVVVGRIKKKKKKTAEAVSGSESDGKEPPET